MSDTARKHFPDHIVEAMRKTPASSAWLDAVVANREGRPYVGEPVVASPGGGTITVIGMTFTGNGAGICSSGFLE